MYMVEKRDPSLEQLEVMDAASRKVRSRGETGDAAAEDEEAAVVLGVLQAVEATCGSRRRRHGVDRRGQGRGHGPTQALAFTTDESIFLTTLKETLTCNFGHFTFSKFTLAFSHPSSSTGNIFNSLNTELLILCFCSTGLE